MQEFSDAPPEAIDGSLLGFSQQGFEFGEHLFDWVEIRRVGWQEQEMGTERLKTIHDPLIAAGKEDGVPYEIDKITRTPNTMDAHRIIRWSHVVGKQQEVAERLFMAYWNGGLDVGDRNILLKIAGEAGLDKTDISEKFENGTDVEAVNAEVDHASRMGVTGVPCFIFARKQGLMGAQPAEQLAEAIRRLAT